MYFIFLLFSISFIDFYTPLNYRILAPVFLLVVFLSLPVWQLSLSAIRTRRLAIAILLVMGVSYLWAFSQRSEEYFQHGNHYTSEIWTKSPTLAYLDRVPLDRHVYTNGPDPIRLFHQRYRGLFMLPVRFEVTSQRVNPDFERDMEDLHEKLRDGQAVLVYFEAIERPSLPDTAELRARFLDIPIQRLEDGFALGQAGP